MQAQPVHGPKSICQSGPKPFNGHTPFHFPPIIPRAWVSVGGGGKLPTIASSQLPASSILKPSPHTRIIAMKQNKCCYIYKWLDGAERATGAGGARGSSVPTNTTATAAQSPSIFEKPSPSVVLYDLSRDTTSDSECNIFLSRLCRERENAVTETTRLARPKNHFLRTKMSKGQISDHRRSQQLCIHSFRTGLIICLFTRSVFASAMRLRSCYSFHLRAKTSRSQ